MVGKKLFASTALFALFVAVLPLLCGATTPSCGDVFVVSFNSQKLLPSLYFDTGGPSTITIKSLSAQEYFFSIKYLPGEKWNNTKSFDVVVEDPYGKSRQGEIYFQEPGEKYYLKSALDRVYYNCTTSSGTTDEFEFSFYKETEMNFAGGKKIVANYTKISAKKRLPAFLPKKDVGVSELFVLTTRVSDEYKAGLLLYKNAAGEFEKLALPELGFGYPRVEYVGCCTRLEVASPSPAPSPTPSPSPRSIVSSPTPLPSPSPSLAPSIKPSPSPSPLPSPSPSPKIQLPAAGIDLTSLFLVLAIILIAFAAALFMVLRKKPVRVRVKVKK